jgi:hypothetical protein
MIALDPKAGRNSQARGDTVDTETHRLSIVAPEPFPATRRERRARMGVWTGVVLVLCLVGVVFWISFGENVFTGLVSAAVAWCM